MDSPYVLPNNTGENAEYIREMTAFDPETFNPFFQNLVLYDRTGAAFIVPLSWIQEWCFLGNKLAIIYGLQLGMSFLVLIVLLLLTKPGKRKSIIFINNGLSLLLNSILMLLQCMAVFSPALHIYSRYTQDYFNVTRTSQQTQVAGIVIDLLNVMTVQVSLAFQVKVVCSNLKRIYRNTLFLTSCAIGLAAVGVKFALSVVNAQAILTNSWMSKWAWLMACSAYMMAISIFWACLIFTVKIGFAIHERMKLGLRRFGPMQVLFIMGCQCMIIPAVFELISIVNADLLSDIQSFGKTTVVLFLPLSALWATASIDNKHIGRDETLIAGISNDKTTMKHGANSTAPSWARHEMSTAATKTTRTLSATLAGSPVSGRDKMSDSGFEKYGRLNGDEVMEDPKPGF